MWFSDTPGLTQPQDFPFPLLLNLTFWRCEGWRKKAIRPLRFRVSPTLLSRGHSQSLSHKMDSAGFYSRPGLFFGIGFHIPGTFASRSEGNTPRDLFGWRVIYRTSRVTAGTGWLPKYQSTAWSRRYYKRLAMQGRPSLWQSQRGTE